MLESSQKRPLKQTVVIKNSHTAPELAESGERWATHSGPYMTLVDVLAIEATYPKFSQPSFLSEPVIGISLALKIR